MNQRISHRLSLSSKVKAKFAKKRKALEHRVLHVKAKAIANGNLARKKSHKVRTIVSEFPDFGKEWEFKSKSDNIYVQQVILIRNCCSALHTTESSATVSPKLQGCGSGKHRKYSSLNKFCQFFLSFSDEIETFKSGKEILLSIMSMGG